MLHDDALHGVVVGHTSPVQSGATRGDAVLKQWMLWGCSFPLTDVICLFIYTRVGRKEQWEQISIANVLAKSSLFEFVLENYHKH